MSVRPSFPVALLPLPVTLSCSVQYSAAFRSLTNHTESADPGGKDRREIVGEGEVFFQGKLVAVDNLTVQQVSQFIFEALHFGSRR